MKDQREFTRVGPHFDARIVIDNEPVGQVTTLDISMGGALVEYDGDIDEGSHCQLVISLVNNPELNKITVLAHVARKDGNKLALEFDSVDVDSYQHLEKLVLLNATDPESVQDELNSHLGIKPSHKT